ncbi:hypothetical protein UUU_17800 [Klebsiella pneumoniae subsp. pneumoniae DSM 30104 = JCM 1662 = NBRC 14940]|nr:hypothetical protein UUU_17800 [Klebsiella pneumoniae subsp. pneumoniae DSM 30104 = JCM 1662 = NBRC 14940]
MFQAGTPCACRKASRTILHNFLTKTETRTTFSFSSCFSTVCWFNRAIKFTLFETGTENAKAD